MSRTSNYLIFVKDILKKPKSSFNISDRWNLSRYYYLEFRELFQNMDEKLIDILDSIMTGEVNKTKVVEMIEAELGGLDDIVSTWKVIAKHNGLK
ncbi:MAG: hypothetical protein ACTSUE_20325 [Promethearchaeota archaeon]